MNPQDLGHHRTRPGKMIYKTKPKANLKTNSLELTYMAFPTANLEDILKHLEIEMV